MTNRIEPHFFEGDSTRYCECPRCTLRRKLEAAGIPVLDLDDIPGLVDEWQSPRAPRGAGLGVVFLWAAFVTGFGVGLCVGVWSN